MPDVIAINHIIGISLIIIFTVAMCVADCFGFVIVMDPKHSDDFGVAAFFLIFAVNCFAFIAFYELIKPLISS